MPGFDWIYELNAHLQATLNVEVKPIVAFDENHRLKGIEFFTPLFEHINNRQSIRISYHSYNTRQNIDAVIHPYFLKEYNQRWFLFGRDDKSGIVLTFALDRIESIETVDIKYIPNNDIDFSTYFNNIVGVSISQNTEIEEFIIRIDKEQLPYTLSKPLHKSQRIIRHNDDGSAIIAINVIPNFELTQLLLSFGERITILSPESERLKIKERIEKNLQNYQ